MTGEMNLSSMGELAMENGHVTITPARIEAPFPNGFRMAQYPDGSMELQGAYIWSEGWVGGVIWKPLPIIQVDEHGVAFDE